jgi:hypothetical protein
LLVNRNVECFQWPSLSIIKKTSFVIHLLQQLKQCAKFSSPIWRASASTSKPG